jgi:hypothetical protein
MTPDGADAEIRSQQDQNFLDGLVATIWYHQRPLYTNDSSERPDFPTLRNK